MRLIFIRHADPDYVKDSLTPKGWREAELLAKRVASWKVDAFYCSPLGRAQDTARVSLAKCGQEAITCDFLQEFYYPVTRPNGEKKIAWDMMPSYWTTQEAFYDKSQWVKHPVMQSGDMAEHDRKVREGIDEILASRGYHRNQQVYRFEESKEETLVFFCHLGVSFVMIGHLLGISPMVLWHSFFVAPTAVTILATEEREEGIASFRAQVMGDTQHLTREGEQVSSSGYFTSAWQQ